MLNVLSKLENTEPDILSLLIGMTPLNGSPIAASHLDAILI